MVLATALGCFSVPGPIDPAVVAADLERDGGPFPGEVGTSAVVQAAISQQVALQTAQQAAAVQDALADAGAEHLAAAAALLETGLRAGLDAGFAAVNARLGTDEFAAMSLTTRVDVDEAAMDAGFGAVNARLVTDEFAVTSLTTRVGAEESAMDAGFAASQASLTSLIGIASSLQAQVSLLDGGVATTQAELKSLEVKALGLTSVSSPAALSVASLSASGGISASTLTAGALTVGPTPSFAATPTSYGLVCGVGTLTDVSSAGYEAVRQACVNACNKNLVAHMCTLDEATHSMGAGGLSVLPTTLTGAAAVEQLGNDCFSWTSARDCASSGACTTLTIPALFNVAGWFHGKVIVSSLDCPSGGSTAIALLCCD